jgi:peptidyl-prolyl cis-trans isomerase D
LRNKKKAEVIKQKIGKITTLEAAAAALGKQIEVADSLRMTTRSISSTMGYEPKVNGAAFNPSNKGKVVPEALVGVNGVYVVRVDDVTATAVANANVAEQRKALYQQAKQQAMYSQSAVLTALRNAAKISDKRASIPQL